MLATEARCLEPVQTLPSANSDSAPDGKTNSDLTTVYSDMLQAVVPGPARLPAKVTHSVEAWVANPDRLPVALSAMHQQQLTESESKLAIASLLRVAALKPVVKLPESSAT